jgi:hypothetical protein
MHVSRHNNCFFLQKNIVNWSAQSDYSFATVSGCGRYFKIGSFGFATLMHDMTLALIVNIWVRCAVICPAH